jgi:hypothetical protein
MMTTAQIQDELTRVSYKPGWSIRCYEGRFEGQHIQITVDLPDASDPAHTVTLDIRSALPPIPYVEYLYEWLAWRLGRVELHEMREHLRVNGAPIFDPHAPLAERDQA